MLRTGIKVVLKQLHPNCARLTVKKNTQIQFTLQTWNEIRDTNMLLNKISVKV